MEFGDADDHVVELPPQPSDIRRPQMLIESGEAFPALVDDEMACVPGLPIRLEGNDAILP